MFLKFAKAASCLLRDYLGLDGIDKLLFFFSLRVTLLIKSLPGYLFTDSKELTSFFIGFRGKAFSLGHSVRTCSFFFEIS